MMLREYKEQSRDACLRCVWNGRRVTGKSYCPIAECPDRKAAEVRQAVQHPPVPPKVPA